MLRALFVSYAPNATMRSDALHAFPYHRNLLLHELQQNEEERADQAARSMWCHMVKLRPRPAYFPFFAGFFACARSDAATVFSAFVDFALVSSLPAAFAGFFPVVMVCSLHCVDLPIAAPDHKRRGGAATRYSRSTAHEQMRER